MASKKRRKKASKKKVTKKVTRRRKKATVRVTKASLGSELGLLHKIDKKVTRIDRTVNAGHHLARKAKKAKRRREIEEGWESVAQHGME